MAGRFAPKNPVTLDPPKDDPIDVEYLAKCNGMSVLLFFLFLYDLWVSEWWEWLGVRGVLERIGMRLLRVVGKGNWLRWMCGDWGGGVLFVLLCPRVLLILRREEKRGQIFACRVVNVEVIWQYCATRSGTSLQEL